MIIQWNTGKCETITVTDARRLWFALTGERSGRRGDWAKAKRIQRWFFPPDEMPESYIRREEIERKKIEPELSDAELPWWQK